MCHGERTYLGKAKGLKILCICKIIFLKLWFSLHLAGERVWRVVFIFTCTCFIECGVENYFTRSCMTRVNIWFSFSEQWKLHISNNSFFLIGFIRRMKEQNKKYSLPLSLSFSHTLAQACKSKWGSLYLTPPNTDDLWKGEGVTFIPSPYIRKSRQKKKMLPSPSERNVCPSTTPRENILRC